MSLCNYFSIQLLTTSNVVKELSPPTLIAKLITIIIITIIIIVIVIITIIIVIIIIAKAGFASAEVDSSVRSLKTVLASPELIFGATGATGGCVKFLPVG